MDKKVKIVMLVGISESSKIVYNFISKDFNIVKVIEDTPVSRKIFFKKRIKKIGFYKVFGQILFIIYNIVFLKKQSNRRIEEIKNRYSLLTKFYPDEVFIKVKSANNKETIDALKTINPDIVLVNGTRIISERVLTSIDAVFINTHVGITPSYRGVHGGYWSLVNNDHKNCGVTVHLVDKGIDTGGVLYQDIIEIEKKDNFNTYPFLQLAKALPLIGKALNDSIKDKIIVKKGKNKESKLYTHPTLLEYIKFKLLYKVK